MTRIRQTADLRRRAAWRTTSAAVQLLLLVGFSFLVWPTSLGGRVSYVSVDGVSMEPTYHFGDLAVVRSRSSYRTGEPIVYRIPKGEFGAGAQVIHRIVGGDESAGFITRGDNKELNDPWRPRDRDVVGRVAFVVPNAGAWFGYLARPINVGILCASITVGCLLWPRGPETPRPAEPLPDQDPEPLAGMRGAVRG